MCLDAAGVKEPLVSLLEKWRSSVMRAPAQTHTHSYPHTHACAALPPYFSAGVRAENGAAAVLTRLRTAMDVRASVALKDAIGTAFGTRDPALVHAWAQEQGLPLEDTPSEHDEVWISAALPLSVVACAGRYTLWLSRGSSSRPRLILSWVADARDGSHVREDTVSSALGGTQPRILHAIIVWWDGRWRVALDGLTELAEVDELMLFAPSTLSATEGYAALDALIASRATQCRTAISALDSELVSALTLQDEADDEDEGSFPMGMSLIEVGSRFPAGTPADARPAAAPTPVRPVAPTRPDEDTGVASSDTAAALRQLFRRIAGRRQAAAAREPALEDENAETNEVGSSPADAVASSEGGDGPSQVPAGSAFRFRQIDPQGTSDLPSIAAAEVPPRADASSSKMGETESDEGHARHIAASTASPPVYNTLFRLRSSSSSKLDEADEAKLRDAADEDDDVRARARRAPSLDSKLDGSEVRALASMVRGRRRSLTRTASSASDASSSTDMSGGPPAARARARDSSSASDAASRTEAPAPQKRKAARSRAHAASHATTGSTVAAHLRTLESSAAPEKKPEHTDDRELEREARFLQRERERARVRERHADRDHERGVQRRVSTRTHDFDASPSTGMPTGERDRSRTRAERSASDASSSGDAPTKATGSFGRARSSAAVPAPAKPSTAATVRARARSSSPEEEALQATATAFSRKSKSLAPKSGILAVTQALGDMWKRVTGTSSSRAPSKAEAPPARSSARSTDTTAKAGTSLHLKKDGLPDMRYTASKAATGVAAGAPPGAAVRSSSARGSSPDANESAPRGPLAQSAPTQAPPPGSTTVAKPAFSAARAAPAPHPGPGVPAVSPAISRSSAAAAPPIAPRGLLDAPTQAPAGVSVLLPPPQSAPVRAAIDTFAPSQGAGAALPQASAAVSAPPLQGHYVLVAPSESDANAAVLEAEARARAAAVRDGMRSALADPRISQLLQDASTTLAEVEADRRARGLSTPMVSLPAADGFVMVPGQDTQAMEATQPRQPGPTYSPAFSTEETRLAYENFIGMAPANPGAAAADYSAAPLAQPLDGYSAGVRESAGAPVYSPAHALPLDAADSASIYSGLQPVSTAEYTSLSGTAASVGGTPGPEYTPLAGATRAAYTSIGSTDPACSHEYTRIGANSTPSRYDAGLNSLPLSDTTTRKNRFVTYIAPEQHVEDAARFSVYAPLVVAPTHTFTISVYMYVKADEKHVREVASSGGATDRGSSLRDFPVHRGELVTLALYLSPGVLSIEASPWQLSHQGSHASEAALLAPSKLKFIQAKRAAGRRVGMSMHRWSPSAAEVPGPSPEVAGNSAGPQLRRMPDATAHIVWRGTPEFADFHVRCTSAAAALLGSHACFVTAIAGSRVLKFRFQINVGSMAEVARMNARAAATAGSLQRGEVNGLAAHAVWELGTRGMLDTSACDEADGVRKAGASAVSPVLTMESKHDYGDIGVGAESEATLTVVDVADDRLLLRPDQISCDAFGSAGVLSRGRHGTVQLALLDGDRVVVVKQPCLDPHTAGDAAIRAFRHEARVQAALGEHPNLVRLHGVCTGDSDPTARMLVLEYLPMGSLRKQLTHAAQARAAGSGSLLKMPLWDAAASVVRRTCENSATRALRLRTSDGQYNMMNYMDFTEAVAGRFAQAIDAPSVPCMLARDIAAGLAALHASGYIHRDVAARNVLLSASAQQADVTGARFADVTYGAKVCDMGLAVRLGMAEPEPHSADSVPAPQRITRVVSAFDEAAQRYGGADAHRTPDGIDSSGNAPLSPATLDHRSSSSVELDGYGTPGWLAPETLRWNLVSQASDVYAFGCVLFELCDERHREPWQWCPSREEVTRALFSEPPSSALPGERGLMAQLTPGTRAKLPPALWSLMQQCLSFDGSTDAFDENASDDVMLEHSALKTRPTMAEVCVALENALIEAV